MLDSAKLDYETVHELIVLIECTETNRMHAGRTKYRTGRINMLVKLANLNDNPITVVAHSLPTTSSSSSLAYTVEENAQSLPHDLTGRFVQIADLDLADSLDDSQVRVELDSGGDGDHFRIVKLSRFLYQIQATQAFDYEFKTRYEFGLSAHDGVHVTRVPITVDILDLNDNAPRFETSHYEFRIDENSPINSVIGQVVAADLDKTPENNQTVFMFADRADENVFSLDRASGLLTVFDASKLDRELRDTFNVSVIAYNPNKPDTMKDLTHVLIRLNDLNDNVPTFERTMYQVSVREKLSRLPYAMLSMRAADSDLRENGSVKYELVRSSASDLFAIDSNTGKLYLTTFLNADLKETSQVCGTASFFFPYLVEENKKILPCPSVITDHILM